MRVASAAFAILALPAFALAQDVIDADRSQAFSTLAAMARAINQRDLARLQEVADSGFDLSFPLDVPGRRPSDFAMLSRRWSAPGTPPPRPYSFQPRQTRRLSTDTILIEGTWAELDPVSRVPGDAGLFHAVLLRQAPGMRVGLLRMDPPLQLPHGEPVAPAKLPEGEWTALFDGKTSAGWVASGGGKFPAEWAIEDGSLITLPVTRSGPRYSIQTSQAFSSFELELEWKLAPGANSGIKYRIFVSRIFQQGAYDVAYEYQLADDAGDPGARVDPRQRTGALYAGLAPLEAAAHAPGEWNQSRLLVRGRKAEHWLNGRKVMEYEFDEPVASPIALQHHQTRASFRNIRIRPLAD